MLPDDQTLALPAQDGWHDPGLWTDLYHPDAAYVAWCAGQNPIVTFDVMVREAPFGGAYMVAAGINAALHFISQFCYGPPALAYLHDLGYPEDFLAELARLRFTGDVVAIPEGRVFFPQEPILRVTAPFREALLVESGVLRALNTATLVATKAARIVHAAAGKPVAEFGFRRAQAPLVAAYASHIGGVASTSLLAAAQAFGIPASGTIPHALVQLFESEEEAFRAVARTHPRFSLLLDTYDTIRGAELAARVGRWARAELGHELAAVRLDSGDLVELSRRVRTILDHAGLAETQILASGDLDEWSIQAIIASGAPVDGFGVGTALVTGMGSARLGIPGGALGGVYKLACVERADGSTCHPTMKIAGKKTTWPGVKQVARSDAFTGDIIQLAHEPMSPGYTPLLQPAIHAGQVLAPFVAATVEQAAARLVGDLAILPLRWQALQPSDGYPIVYSQALQAIRDSAVAEHDLRGA